MQGKRQQAHGHNICYGGHAQGTGIWIFFLKGGEETDSHRIAILQGSFTNSATCTCRPIYMYSRYWIERGGRKDMHDYMQQVLKCMDRLILDKF